MLKFLAAALCLGLPGAASALETVEMGLIGSPNSGAWPFLIGVDEGMYAQAGVTLDLVYEPTAPGLMQELAAGSLDAVSIGLVEPIHAAAKGAPVAILRISADVTPYEMLAAKSIHRIEDLRGKTWCIGGLLDINAVYLDRVMTAHGLGTGDYDVIVLGNTAQRYAALKSGTVDATMLVPPANFIAEKDGFTDLGLIMDYTKDIPMGGVSVNIAWARKHPDAAKAMIHVLDRSIAWLYDLDNREAAIDLLVRESHADRGEVAQSYDFIRRIRQYTLDNRVSKSRVENLIEAMRKIGDLQGTAVSPDKLVLAGITAIAP